MAIRFAIASRNRTQTDQDYTGLVWKAEETPRVYQSVYCAWGSETKEDRDVKRKRGEEWFWVGLEKK